MRLIEDQQRRRELAVFVPAPDAADDARGDAAGEHLPLERGELVQAIEFIDIKRRPTIKIRVRRRVQVRVIEMHLKL